MRKICFDFIFLALIGAFSCDTKSKPYLNHSIEKPEKIADDCSGYDPKINMVSNIIGERYEFQKCLHGNYEGEYKIARKADTVDVSFPGGPPAALYKIVLNIDTYPRYNYLTIDGNTVRIIPAGN
jgi:hypothetical protein